MASKSAEVLTMAQAQRRAEGGGSSVDAEDLVATELDLTPKKCRNLQENEARYQLFANLYWGRVVNPPDGTRHPHDGTEIDTYLLRHEQEDAASWETRKKAAFVLPYSRDIIRVQVATLFRQDVVREVVERELGKEHLADVDRRGHEAKYFTKQAFILAEIFGWVGGMTDTPEYGKPGPRTLLDEQRAGLRPYSWLVQPLDLWDWARAQVTKAFTKALIHSATDEWTWWFPDVVVTVDREGKRTKPARRHGLEEVPLEILTCDTVESSDPLMPFGLSAQADIDRLALHLYQLCSQLEAHDREVLFTFLHLQADPPKGKAQAADLHVGNSHYIWVNGPVGYVTPPESVPKELRAQIAWGHQEMRRAAGVSTRSEESQEAHSGVAIIWEAADKHALIHDRGQNLEAWESALWRRHARYLGGRLEGDCVRYPRDYVMHSVDQELGQIERIVKVFGSWSQVPAGVMPYLERKFRRLIIRDMGHLPEAKDLLKAVQFAKEPDDALRERLGPPAGVDPRQAGAAGPGVVREARGEDGDRGEAGVQEDAEPGQPG